MYFHGQPPTRRLCDFLVFQAEKSGDAGAGQVDVKDAHVVALLREGEGELEGYARFTDAAFAAEDEDDVLDVLEAHVVKVVGGLCSWLALQRRQTRKCS